MQNDMVVYSCRVVSWGELREIETLRTTLAQAIRANHASPTINLGTPVVSIKDVSSPFEVCFLINRLLPPLQYTRLAFRRSCHRVLVPLLPLFYRGAGTRNTPLPLHERVMKARPGNISGAGNIEGGGEFILKFVQ